MTRHPLARLTGFLWLLAVPMAAFAAPGMPPDTAGVGGGVAPALRVAYERAWTLRVAGEPGAAMAAADSGLALIEDALGADPGAALRRDLVELRSRLAGLRGMAADDLAQAAGPDAGRDDSGILDTPAAEPIEVQLNADVIRWIEFFTGNGRSVFERWLKRSGQYMELFRAVLRREGLPPDLVHLVFVESGFNVHARSYAAAVGPWQFLRSTARLFGLTVNQWVDERKDPEKSTVAAARYLKHLYSIFGDWPLALASYNAGEGAVLRAIKRQGTTNYWDLKLPRQTEEYVPQFMAVLAISRDPARYGFDSVELDEPMQFDEVAFKGPVDLRVIAEMCGTTDAEMRRLNPGVVRHAASGAGGVTTVRVPPGTAAVLLEKLRDGAPLPPVQVTLQHRVRRGETLSGIAARYHVSARELARMNGIDRAHLLQRGQLLSIPATMARGTPVLADADDPRASTAYVPPREIRPPARIEARSEAEGRVTHVVRRGETLSAIAERYGVTVADIREWNRLTAASVRRGTRLKIRTGEAIASAGERAARDSAIVAGLKPPSPRRPALRRGAGSDAGARLVVVRRGDTLSHIAARHGVSVTALKRANGLSSDAIRAGQRLRLPG